MPPNRVVSRTVVRVKGGILETRHLADGTAEGSFVAIGKPSPIYLAWLTR